VYFDKIIILLENHSKPSPMHLDLATKFRARGRRQRTSMEKKRLLGNNKIELQASLVLRV